MKLALIVLLVIGFVFVIESRQLITLSKVCGTGNGDSLKAFDLDDLSKPFTDLVDVEKLQANTFWAFTMDQRNGYLFFSVKLQGSGDDTILRTNLEGDNLIVLANEEGIVRAMAVDSKAGELFYAERATTTPVQPSKIAIVPVNGATNPVTWSDDLLLNGSPIPDIEYMLYDENLGHLFFTTSDGPIWRSNRDKSEVVQMTNEVANFYQSGAWFDIDFKGNYIYYSNPGVPERVQRVPIGSPNDVEVLYYLDDATDDRTKGIHFDIESNTVYYVIQKKIGQQGTLLSTLIGEDYSLSPNVTVGSPECLLRAEDIFIVEDRLFPQTDPFSLRTVLIIAGSSLVGIIILFGIYQASVRSATSGGGKGGMSSGGSGGKSGGESHYSSVSSNINRQSIGSSRSSGSGRRKGKKGGSKRGSKRNSSSGGSKGSKGSKRGTLNPAVSTSVGLSIASAEENQRRLEELKDAGY